MDRRDLPLFGDLVAEMGRVSAYTRPCFLGLEGRRHFPLLMSWVAVADAGTGFMSHV